MKQFKKILAAALVCVMALAVLTGCSKTAADYQNDLTKKMTNANIGVSVDAQMNRSADLVSKNINGAVRNYIMSGTTDQFDARALINSIIKNAGISENTKWCASLTYSGQTISYGFTTNENHSLAPADFFVSEVKSYNEAHPQAKLTKVGIGLYKTPWLPLIGSIDVVILLAE